MFLALIEQLTVVVCGLGKVGFGIAHDLLLSGFHVAAFSRNHNQNADILEREYPGFFSFYPIDVTNKDDVADWLVSLSAERHCAGLVNATSYRPSVHQAGISSIESWKDSILYNSLCLHVPTSAVIDYFILNKIAGSIVTVSSMYGLVAPRFELYEGTSYWTEVDYAYNKSASIGYSKYIAARYAKHGIRSNVICPGGVFAGQEDRFLDNYARTVPLARMANASEIGPLATFLISDKSSYITGSVIPVDGGWTCQ